MRVLFKTQPPALLLSLVVTVQQEALPEEAAQPWASAVRTGSYRSLPVFKLPSLKEAQNEPRSRISRSYGHFMLKTGGSVFCPHPPCAKVPVTPTLSRTHPALSLKACQLILNLKNRWQWLVEIILPFRVRCQRAYYVALSFQVCYW